MFRFQDRVFVKRGEQWFTWEPSWDSMRPITGFAWNGQNYVIQDDLYTQDPFDESFGFGDLKQVCDALTEECLPHLESAPFVSYALVGAPMWVRDRFVVVTSPEVTQTWRSHLAWIRSRPRTARHMPRGKRSTKRTLLSDKTCASTSS